MSIRDWDNTALLEFAWPIEALRVDAVEQLHLQAKVIERVDVWVLVVVAVVAAVVGIIVVIVGGVRDDTLVELHLGLVLVLVLVLVLAPAPARDVAKAPILRVEVVERVTGWVLVGVCG